MSSAFPRPTISAANGCAIIAAFPLKRLHHRMRPVDADLVYTSTGGADHSTRKWRPHVNCGTDSAITPMAMCIHSPFRQQPSLFTTIDLRVVRYNS